MSRTLSTVDGLQLSRFCGPAELGSDRTMYQVGYSDTYVQMTKRQMLLLCARILEDLCDADTTN